MRQFLRFACVGTAGFACDSLLLYAGLALGLGYVIARLISFGCGMVVTWWLNREITFHHGRVRPSFAEFGKYCVAMSVGGTVNYGLAYFTLLHLPKAGWAPLLAVVVGSGAAMMVNFASTRWYVFRR